MLNFFSSSYSVYENGVIFIQTLFICKIAKNYNSSIVFLIKNNENLKSLFFFTIMELPLFFYLILLFSHYQQTM